MAAVASVVFLLLQVLKFNFLSIACFLVATAVLGRLTWSIVGGIVHKPPPPLPKVLTEGVAEAQLKNLAEKATPHVNKGLHFAHRVLSGKDAFMSATVGSSFAFASYMLARVSLLAVAYLLLVIAFTVPKVYDMYKDQIDAALNSVREKATKIYDEHLAKLVKQVPTAAKFAAATPAESSSARKED